MAYQAVLRKLPTYVLNGSLEDVLTASVIGAIAYGPAGMAQEWLRSFGGMPDPSTELRFEFWPEHRLVDGGDREPDVLVLDDATKRILVIEAKRDSDPRSGQLIDEGDAVSSAYPDMALHLMTVSDQAITPRAYGRVQKERPGLYHTMRHASWADLYRFLEGWGTAPSSDPGHRRMIEDAQAVVRKFGRDPFRGMTRQEVRMMERDIGWMVALPSELVKLHRGLSRTLEEQHPPLYPMGRNVRTDKVGSVSYSSPEQWLPRHFTVRYGEAPGTESPRYYFVRAVLNPPEVWVGYAPQPQDIKALVADPQAVEKLVGRAGRSVCLVGVTPKGKPFELVAGPVELSMTTLQQMSTDPRVKRVNIVQIFPMTVMQRAGADVKLETALLHLRKACRSVPVLGTP